MSAEGGEPRLRFSLGEAETFYAADWAPDAKAIAYIRGIKATLGRDATIEIRTLQDAKSRIILRDQALYNEGQILLKWLPDNQILFPLAGNTIRESDLWRLSLDSNGVVAGTPTRLTNAPGVLVENVTASADGKRAAVFFVREQQPVFVADLGKTGDRLERPRRLTNDSWLNYVRAWAPDSQALFICLPMATKGAYTSTECRRIQMSCS
jgi:Tol biopolymer transport system component